MRTTKRRSALRSLEHSRLGPVFGQGGLKLRTSMTSTRERWAGSKYDFHLIAHEHLYVFRKPEAGEKLSEYRHNVK